jgi:hypothetical protein
VASESYAAIGTGKVCLLFSTSMLSTQITSCNESFTCPWLNAAGNSSHEDEEVVLMRICVKI